MTRIRSLLLFILVMTLLLIDVACTRAYEFKGTPFDPPTSVPDFELMADHGQPFRLSESNSAITLVYFGYTFCPDVCPLTMVNIKVALLQLEQTQRARVQVIFISVDPERDTPQVLDRFLSAFDPTFIGLTDDFGKIQKVLPIFRVFAAK
jgi:protein SCO1